MKDPRRRAISTFIEVFSPCDFIAAITQHIPDKSGRRFGAFALPFRPFSSYLADMNIALSTVSGSLRALGQKAISYHCSQEPSWAGHGTLLRARNFLFRAAPGCGRINQ